MHGGIEQIREATLDFEFAVIFACPHLNQLEGSVGACIMLSEHIIQ